MDNITAISHVSIDELYSNVLKALDNKQYNSAKLYYEAFVSVCSKDDYRLKALSAKFEKETMTPFFYYEKLFSYISNREYCAAKSLLPLLLKEYPDCDIQSFQLEINEKIERANQIFNNKVGINMYDANIAMNALEIVADFEPAISFVKQVTPSKCLSINVESLPQDGLFISWVPSEDKNVTFTLVRNSLKVPKEIDDGEVLVRQMCETQYLDTNVQDYRTYYYVVFEERLGTISDGCSGSGLWEKSLSNVSTIINDYGCLIEWESPKNSLGTRIFRENCSIENSSKELICLHTKDNYYQDVGISENCTYRYYLEVIYKHKNLEYYATPFIIENVLNQRLLSGPSIENYEFNAEESSLELFINDEYKHNIVYALKSYGDFSKENQTIKITDISKYGEILYKGRIDANSIVLDVKKNNEYHMVCAVQSGLSVTFGNICCIPTFNFCKVNKKRTGVKNGRLNIVFEQPQPKDVVEILYTIRSAEYRFSDCITINTEKIRPIRVDDIPKDVFVLEIASKIRDGNDEYISPYTSLSFNNIEKQIVDYEIKHKRFGNPVLFISNNKPKMHLVACEKGIPNGYVGEDIIYIMTIDSSVDISKGITLTKEILEKVPKKSMIRLFLDKEYMDYYEMNIKDVNGLIRK